MADDPHFPHSVPLSKSILTHSGRITTLKLREPSARDFISLKRTPFSLVFYQEVRGTDKDVDPDKPIERKGEMTTDYALVFEWASRLSGVETLILQNIDNGRDVHAITGKLQEILAAQDSAPTDKKATEEGVKNSSES